MTEAILAFFFQTHYNAIIGPIIWPNTVGIGDQWHVSPGQQEPVKGLPQASGGRQGRMEWGRDEQNAVVTKELQIGPGRAKPGLGAVADIES